MVSINYRNVSKLMFYSTEPQQNKAGTFEWIQSFAQIARFLSSHFTGLPESTRESQRVLVLGCGTSTLSKDLLDLGYGEVVNIDNDSACVQHMANMYSDPRMKWYTYDLVEYSGDNAIKGSTCDGAFDIVVDKGTLDAILVEGAVYRMLAEVHRFMRPNGIYILCSINSEQILQSLVGAPALDFEVSLNSIIDHTNDITGSEEGDAGAKRYNLHTNPSAKVQGIVAICKKRPDTAGTRVDLDALAQQEKEALDFYFKDEEPLLTPELELQLRHRFMTTLSKVGGETITDLTQLHAIILNEAERAAYTLDLFLEDLKVFQQERNRPIHTGLSCDEAVEFLYQMQ